MSHLRLGLLDRLRNRYLGPRRGVVKYRVQDGVELRCFWKVLEVGRGPGAALYILDKEILRFDCFGLGGHYHVHPWEDEPGKVSRRAFDRQTTEAQIESAVKELSMNLSGYLTESSDANIRSFKVDAEALAKAALWMKARLTIRGRSRD